MLCPQCRYEKRHGNIAAHVSPCFRVAEGDTVVIGQCRWGPCLHSSEPTAVAASSAGRRPGMLLRVAHSGAQQSILCPFCNIPVHAAVCQFRNPYRKPRV